MVHRGPPPFTKPMRFQLGGESAGFSLHRPTRSSSLSPVSRGLHSSTFQLNVSTVCWIRWVHDFPQVY